MEKIEKNDELKNHIQKFIETKDEKSFTFIYNHFKKKLDLYLLKYEKDPINRENLISETFLKVLENIHTYDKKYHFSTWIYNICRNEFLLAKYYLKDGKNKIYFKHAGDPIFFESNRTDFHETDDSKSLGSFMEQMIFLQLNDSDLNIVHLNKNNLSDSRFMVNDDNLNEYLKYEDRCLLEKIKELENEFLFLIENEILKLIPKKFSDPYYLYEFKKMSYKEIAVKLSVKLGDVFNRIRAARIKIYQILIEKYNKKVKKYEYYKRELAGF